MDLMFKTGLVITDNNYIELSDTVGNVIIMLQNGTLVWNPRFRNIILI